MEILINTTKINSTDVVCKLCSDDRKALSDSLIQFSFKQTVNYSADRPDDKEFPENISEHFLSDVDVTPWSELQSESRQLVGLSVSAKELNRLTARVRLLIKFAWRHTMVLAVINLSSLRDKNAANPDEQELISLMMCDDNDTLEQLVPFTVMSRYFYPIIRDIEPQV